MTQQDDSHGSAEADDDLEAMKQAIERRRLIGPPTVYFTLPDRPTMEPVDPNPLSQEDLAAFRAAIKARTRV